MWTVDIQHIRPTWLEQKSCKSTTGGMYAPSLMEQFGFTFESLLEAGRKALMRITKQENIFSPDDSQMEIDVVGDFEGTKDYTTSEMSSPTVSMATCLVQEQQQHKSSSGFNIKDILESPGSAAKTVPVYEPLMIEIPAPGDASLEPGFKHYFSNERKTTCFVDEELNSYVARLCQCYGVKQQNSLVTPGFYSCNPQHAPDLAILGNTPPAAHSSPVTILPSQSKQTFEDEPLDLRGCLASSQKGWTLEQYGAAGGPNASMSAHCQSSGHPTLTPSVTWQPQGPQAMQQALSSLDQACMAANPHSQFMDLSARPPATTERSFPPTGDDTTQGVSMDRTQFPMQSQPITLQNTYPHPLYPGPQSMDSMAPGQMMTQHAPMYDSAAFRHITSLTQNFPSNQLCYPEQGDRTSYYPGCQAPGHMMTLPSPYAREAAARLASLAQLDHTYSTTRCPVPQHMPQPSTSTTDSKKAYFPMHYLESHQQWRVGNSLPGSDMYASQQRLEFYSGLPQNAENFNALSMFADVALEHGQPAYHNMPPMVL